MSDLSLSPADYALILGALAANAQQCDDLARAMAGAYAGPAAVMRDHAKALRSLADKIAQSGAHL